MKWNVMLASCAVVFANLQAQGAYTTGAESEDLLVEQSSSEDVIAWVRPRTIVEGDESEIFEAAPEELLLSAELMEEELKLASAGEDFWNFLNGKNVAKPAESNLESKGKTKSTKGKTAHVKCHSNQGGASFYGSPQKTASGARFNPSAMTAAHRHLPFGHQLRVTNLSNGKSVVVTINDRGPFIGGRIIDLSKASFAKIASLKQGVARVRIESVSCF